MYGNGQQYGNQQYGNQQYVNPQYGGNNNVQMNSNYNQGQPNNSRPIVVEGGCCNLIWLFMIEKIIVIFIIKVIIWIKKVIMTFFSILMLLKLFYYKYQFHIITNLL